ncbi:GNAT family N-acetyltransferase [Methylobrevis albus]|uniref:GNAT family N-acetyltransferase n=1 Tax=Methylobrevis albus TaxID=2793297 RepID=A0A931MY15_9HYPH|nr:GNAT family N-acetyltransferase [Methylobrevis albus]MBH0236246.1 GNAT family N-acetyltransferase [Methylobrevis albus]
MSTEGCSTTRVRELRESEIRERAGELAGVLFDAVSGGVRTAFAAPRWPLDAVRGVLDLADAVARGTIVLVAEHDGEIVGSVQLRPARSEVAPRRMELSTLVVHHRARRRGVASALTAAAEEAARERGCRILSVDTAADGEGRHVYDRLGFARVRFVPALALAQVGVDTISYHKVL